MDAATFTAMVLAGMDSWTSPLQGLIETRESRHELRSFTPQLRKSAEEFISMLDYIDEMKEEV